jgi:hypothetical protein
MRSLFKNVIRIENSPRPYIMVKLWWVKKMNGLTRDLSKSQLLISLFVFTILGTLLSFYIAISGFLNHNSRSVRIDAMTTVTNTNNNYKSKVSSTIRTKKSE